MEVYTICPKCKCRFDWTMSPGIEAPDCPHCGFDATGREEARKLRNGWRCFEGHTGKVLSARFSQDGRLIASGGGDRVVRLWDVANRKQLCALSGHKEEISAVAFLPDGSRVLSSSGDGTLKLWDLGTRQELGTLTGHTRWVMCMDVSPDGKIIASGSATPDPTIKLWDLESLKERFSLSMPCRVNAIRCSPDAHFVAAANDNQTISIIDAGTGATVRTMNEQGKEQLLSLAISPDSTIVASCDGFAIKLWDVASGHCQATLVADDQEPSYSAYAAAFSSDGETLVAVGGNKVRLWDLQTMKRRKTLEGRSIGLCSVFFKPFDARVFVTAGDGFVNVRSIEEDGITRSTPKKSPEPASGRVPSVSATPQSRPEDREDGITRSTPKKSPGPASGRVPSVSATPRSRPKDRPESAPRKWWQFWR